MSMIPGNVVGVLPVQAAAAFHLLPDHFKAETPVVKALERFFTCSLYEPESDWGEAPGCHSGVVLVRRYRRLGEGVGAAGGHDEQLDRFAFLKAAYALESDLRATDAEVTVRANELLMLRRDHKEKGRLLSSEEQALFDKFPVLVECGPSLVDVPKITRREILQPI